MDVHEDVCVRWAPTTTTNAASKVNRFLPSPIYFHLQFWSVASASLLHSYDGTTMVGSCYRYVERIWCRTHVFQTAKEANGGEISYLTITYRSKSTILSLIVIGFALVLFSIRSLVGISQLQTQSRYIQFYSGEHNCRRCRQRNNSKTCNESTMASPLP